MPMSRRRIAYSTRSPANATPRDTRNRETASMERRAEVRASSRATTGRSNLRLRAGRIPHGRTGAATPAR